MVQTASVLLTHTGINSGAAVRVLCSGVKLSGIKNNNKKPNANANSMAEVQTQTYENLKYLVDGIKFTGEANVLSFADILVLYKELYNGSNAATLNVTYGNNTVLSGLAESTDISVIMDTFNFPIDVKTSKDGYLPVGSIVFTETK